MKTLLRKAARLTVVITLIGTSVNAQDGKAIFNQNCAACHTVGGGRLVGPDLQSINYVRDHNWILKFVQSSQSLIKSGDATAIEVYEKYNKMIMPDQSLSDSEVKSIIKYIESISPEPKGDEDASNTIEESVEVVAFTPSEEDIAEGKKLFLGYKRFENGGLTCVSCHNVSSDGMIPGGKLAADLTQVYSKLGGPEAIEAILNSPPFPAMKVSYEDNPLTEQEIHELQAFLKDADENHYYHVKSDYNSFFGSMGFFMLLIILSAIATIWAKKKQGHVKEDIYDRQINSKQHK